jgi:hypothetical protein
MNMWIIVLLLYFEFTLLYVKKKNYLAFIKGFQRDFENEKLSMENYIIEKRDFF